jgi:hypothetical protein
MKARRPFAPPVVVTKPRRSTVAPTAPRRAAPDRKIRAWSADDVERQEEEQFSRRPDREQIEAAITAWCARFQRPNDPDIAKQIGRQGVGRDLTEASMSHMQVIEDKRDPRVILRPHKGRWSQLKQGLAMQYGHTKLIVTDPKAPKRQSWWAYVKDLRSNTKE